MSDGSMRLDGVGKMYKIFPSRAANLLDALGLPGRGRYHEFWALRGIDLELAKGSRLGIVGRNGAGKTTLLKLVTGNIVPTEGKVDVHGEVQALIEAGAGFHPEFTGDENIRAALTLQGVAPGAMDDLIHEIAEFTELGEFLGQPFRTYSAGMQARLAFATATSIEPEILIVDEMLSAGDAYFASKAGERMRRLVESGASLLLVSHSLDHISMFCEEAIWIDRGRIVERGSSLEVVKSYQQFTRLLDERRIQARNRKALSGKVPSHQLENYGDQIVVRVTTTTPDTALSVRSVSLLREGEVEQVVHVGDPQDANESLDAFVLLDGGGWTDPHNDGSTYMRSIAAAGGAGTVVFNLYTILEESAYAVDITFSGGIDGSPVGRLELLHEGVVQATAVLHGSEAWETTRLRLDAGTLGPRHVGAELVGPRTTAVPASFAGESDRPPRRRWPGEGSLTVSAVRILDQEGTERTVFERGETIEIETTLTAHETEAFPLVLGVSLYRIDGLLVSNHAGPQTTIDLEDGRSTSVCMTLPEVNLGDGRYTFSVAAFRNLDPHGDSKLYDLIDRSFEFEVYGNGPFENGVFNHPVTWTVGVPNKESGVSA